ncbi:MAG: HAD family hydrolase [Thermoplasmata archaeon]
MNGMPWQLVTIDIDGTLTTVHGWRVIAERAGRLAEYAETNRAFLAGDIGEDEHLRDLLEIAVGLPNHEFETALSITPRIAGIDGFVRKLHDEGVRVVLLTHNPTLVCEWYQRTFGFDDFAGVPGSAVEGGRLGALPPVRADKVAGLKELLGRLSVAPNRVVHIGDGWADARVFPRVGGGVALNSAWPEVRRAADLALDLEDLRPLAERLRSLHPREHVNDA